MRASWDFPGSAVVKIPSFQHKGKGLIPNQGKKAPHAA